MTKARLVKISKYLSQHLSQHLRHAPEGLELTLAPGGWVGAGDLSVTCARRQFEISRDELSEVVAKNSKQGGAAGVSALLSSPRGCLASPRLTP